MNASIRLSPTGSVKAIPQAVLGRSCSGAGNLRKYLGGDWAGIIARIQDGYLTDMGFSAILISQPAENIHVCMEDEEGTASYHGYWPRDFLRPNPYFGSMDTFRALLSTNA
ncbi:hypothetical protein JI735_17200 [Paenibacillus sonchi]|uniref:Glycosyl hydrolase family 13 catalytic domain-containing protein n=1 Tax=Paenibacillus sonchi TaxID=373687 RepID=A0A974P718_9BACL|nr:alpha-amylase family glycosyl hydrolase [Paenibacillus sonchi]MCE3199565.1 hypothetical protein [Paenibacillus sonchi]QQZ58545.1 hypothetical protein JI735_17200 [Paenibacillus sonchi]